MNHWKSNTKQFVFYVLFLYLAITKVPGNTFFPTPLKWFCGESESSFCGAIYEKAQLSCWEARTAAAVEMSTASIPSRRGRELMQQIQCNLYCWYIAYAKLQSSAPPYLSEVNPSLNSSFGVWQCKTFEHSNCQISSVMWYSSEGLLRYSKIIVKKL